MGIAQMQKYILNRYDTLCDMPEIRDYYGQSHFINFGYWDGCSGDQKQACEKLMEKLLDFIPYKRGTILDVACGKGETSRYLTRYYNPEQITGINISEKQLTTAKSLVPGATFLLMDAAHLEFEDTSFDNIICVEAVFHFYTREKFLREAHRVLKRGGRLVLSDILMTLEGERRRESRTEKNYVKDLEEYETILRRAGFNELELIDATESCWEGHFWNAVLYFHRKFLSREIDQAQLATYLHHTYHRVPDIKYYLLVAVRKD